MKVSEELFDNLVNKYIFVPGVFVNLQINIDS